MLLSLLTSPGKLLCVSIFKEHNVKTSLYRARGPVQNELDQAEISKLPLLLFTDLQLVYSLVGHHGCVLNIHKSQSSPALLRKDGNSVWHLLYLLFLSLARMTADYKHLHIVWPQL